MNLELAGQNVVVAVFGMGEDARPGVERLLAGLRHAVERAPGRVPSGVGFAPPPPWGELAMTPREAFFGPQEVVPADDAAGRVAAESLAAYPPGIPNVLPGERLTAETIQYVAGRSTSAAACAARATAGCARFAWRLRAPRPRSPSPRAGRTP